MTHAVVIPTKNRPKELATVFDSLLAQTHLPNQIIIIDQSSTDLVIDQKLIPLANKAGVSLNYVHDESILGLVQAKAASIPYNTCDFISFFDDDIVHEPNYFEEIVKAFEQYPQMIGVNGVILNTPHSSTIRRFLFRITHFGLYKDNRLSVLRMLTPNSIKPIRVDALSGGLSTWHKSVFSQVQFDVKNKFHAYEDKEFSIRIEHEFPQKMFIVPSAKLFHYHAAGNRQSLLKRTQNDVVEVWMLFKKNGNYTYLGFDLVILLLGLQLNALLLTLKHRDITFFKGFILGFNRGRKKEIIR